jgi:hypothetical protein
MNAQKKSAIEVRGVVDLLKSMHERMSHVVPAWWCAHQTPPCLQCSLEYLVESAPRVDLSWQIDKVV